MENNVDPLGLTVEDRRFFVDQPQTVTISRQEYGMLLHSDRILNALLDAGVDNWVWYDDALSTLENKED